MQRHRPLTLQRLQRFKQYLQSLWYDQHHPLTLQAFATPKRIPYEQAIQQTFAPVAVGETLKPHWSTHWFRLKVRIPAAWHGREVHLRWDSSSEACVWQDGRPLQGLSGSGDYWQSPYHGWFKLSANAGQDEAEQTVYIEVAVNTPFGMPTDPPLSHLGLLRMAEIATLRRDYWSLYWDFVIIADMAQHLPDNTPRAGQALAAANAIVNQFVPDDADSLQAARQIAADFLQQNNGASQHTVHAIGHAHLDTAWLWPLAESKRKAVRSFSTAVRLMQDYADYRFVCSQAQHLQWIKDSQPDLYRRIQQQAAAGRFIPTGGAWVEPDCNMPAGEALVRQFLYGQRFYQAEFGRKHRVFWLPDTFGYASALPQILQGVGIDYFLTQKLSWNQFNKLPANTFYWHGLDGSRVLAHFPPADTYNGLGNVQEVLAGTARFRDHDRSNHSLYVFGYGDGGGGPSAAMLEQLQRMGDVDGLPRVQMTDPEAFFDTVRDDVQAGTGDLLAWVGELYFELHRGTYTTQAYVKWANRRSELLLRDVEFLAAWQAADTPYPQDEIERLWKLVLLNQFHDILPGSSIHEVYEDARNDYDDILTSAATLRDGLLNALLPSASDDALTAVNTLSFDRAAVVPSPIDIEGAQRSDDDQALVILSAPAMGYRTQTPRLQADHAATITPSDDGFIMENAIVRAVVDASGHLTSLYDKQRQRESLAGAGNHLRLYDDRPNEWDAWDVDIFHQEKSQPLPAAQAIDIIERGPLRVALRLEIAFGASKLTQIISLTALDAHVTFDTQVDWQESHQLLKVAFPLAVHSLQATYETQYGLVQRPTHMNTAWDMARFEVCGHRWAALIEHQFGVALLNDSKYGYSANGNTLALSLLRAPAWPDASADRGNHRFRYGLMPFDGNVQTAVRGGLCFNVPLHITNTRTQANTQSFMQVDNGQVIIDAVKKAEDDAGIIVRLYEACGGQARVTLTPGFAVQTAYRCNLLEETLDETQATLPLQDNALHLTVRPFEIVTLKLLR